METTTKEETERLIRLLRTAMRLLGFTNREIERRLSYTPSYLTRLFSGQIELRFEHIVDICRAMGMTVDELFRFAYPDRLEKLTAAAEKLHALLEEMRPTPPPPHIPIPWEEEDFQVVLQGSMEKALQRIQEQLKSPEHLIAMEKLLKRPLSPRKPLAAPKPLPTPKRPQPPARPAAKKKQPA